jgi:Dolichyl-phosphate-mannose-protein mannosyltransferase
LSTGGEREVQMSFSGSERRSSAGRLDPFDLAFALLLAVLVALVLATFKQYAVSNDEGLQNHYGELILAYYRSGFADKSAFGYDNLYLYGGLFDIIAVLISHVLPFNLYDIRHVMSALAGLGGVAASFATARLILGPRAGLIAGVALAACGVWYGGMFNHTKDVPFAAAMMGATFFLLRAARDLPASRWRDTLGFGILLGVALGLRANGLLMVGYLAVAIVLYLWPPRQRGWRLLLTDFARSLARFAPALAIAYAIMVVSWPWASLDFLNPARAIFAFAHFHYPIRTVIAGQVYLMSDVPRWYEPDYLAIKLPLFVLIGAAGALIVAAVAGMRRAALRQNALQDVGLLVFTIVFPLACQVIGHGPSFTGMRHFLFVVPPLAVLAGLGIERFISICEAAGPVPGLAALALVAAAIASDTVVLARLHPYEYLFYNSLVGGLEGASRRYDTDYWVNIMPAAVKDLEAYVTREDGQADPLKPRRYTVAVCGERVAFEKEDEDPRLQFTADWSHADFFIAPTHMNCDQVLRGKVLEVIERVGVPIGVIKDLRGVSAQARWAPAEVAHGPAEPPDAKAAPHG